MYSIKTTYKRHIADTLTPVSIYLKIRDKFANTILLESSDYHGVENNFSYICFSPIARFEVNRKNVKTKFLQEPTQSKEIQDRGEVLVAFQQFIQQFDDEKLAFNFIQNGVFGYTTFDAVQYFEEIDFQNPANSRYEIPQMLYQVYEFVIAINHFNNELYIFHHQPQVDGFIKKYSIEDIETIINNKNFASYHFKIQGEETSNLRDEDFLAMVKLGKYHCQQGDVFQIVLSRQFSRSFQGDEFNVYRALRSINPSPYLFYFDFGSFKIFGSSPEAQIVVKNQKAEIHPIAGTFKRTGNDQADAELAQKLSEDEKESAEHVMLVDLARNDLSRNGFDVKVENFKEIQYYSHLIHLVSKVTAQIEPHISSIQLFADTFPAGTLSGAPKYKALELIDQYENQHRGFYGGAIGFMSFEGDINHAIMIRSFLSKENTLYYQAGAGIVSKSDEQSELQEVNNKLRALRNALEWAEDI